MKDRILALPRKFYSYLKKDVMLLLKRKKYFYLTILLPLIIASIFLFMISPGDHDIKIGVCDLDSSSYSKAAFSDLQGFDARKFDSEDCKKKMISSLKSGEVSLGIEISEDFSENLGNAKQAKMTVFYDNTDISLSRLVSWKVDSALMPYKRKIIDSLNKQLKEKISSLRISVDLALALTSSNDLLNDEIRNIDSDLEKIEELDTDFIVNPIWTDKQPIYKQKLTKDAGIAFIFPIIAMFVILMLSSSSLIYDRKSNFLVRVKTSTSPMVYVISKIIFFFILTMIQFLIVLLIFLLYGSTYQFNIGGVVHMVAFIAVINTIIGLLIGLASDNEGIALLFSLIISFPLMLLSGIFFPLQTMPAVMQYAAKALPLYSQINAVKSVLLFGQSISLFWIYPAIALSLAIYYFLRKAL